MRSVPLLVTVSLVAALVRFAIGARILGIFPHFGVTHWMAFRPLVEELATRGHQVTVVSVFPRDTPMKNYFDISLKESYPADLGYVDLTAMESTSRRSLLEMAPLYQMSALTESTLRQSSVLALANQTFDLILMEYFNTAVYHGLAHKIKAPIVALSSHQITGWASYVMANPDEPSYVPHLLAFRSSPFAFWDRLMNLIELLVCRAAYFQLFVPRAQVTAEKHLGALPKLHDLEANASLILINAHFSMNNPRPLNPNVIEVGGINILPPQPLSADLQELLDRSKGGVIYFSMGTVLKASTLSEPKRIAFVNAFAGLKQTVLWKWDASMKDKPPNVHLSSWYPQRDVFAHKNVVLFISHCGNLGVNEAVHEGIPMICIPMFGDQPYNSKSIESQGMGEVLDFYSDITYEKIKSTINRVLTNPKYKMNARRVSKAYRDRPMSPLHTAVYWVEYVLRHNGAYHMRSAARHMPWYAYHNYDVMIFLHAAIAAIFYLLYKTVVLFMRTLSMCFKSRSKTKVKKS